MSTDKVKEDEMGRAYSMHGGEDECVQDFWWEDQKERDHQEDIDVGGRIILKRILEK
jgi:hypothetical protein